MTRISRTLSLGLVVALALSSISLWSNAQTAAASAPVDGSNKAVKPPVDEAASKSGVATKKASKAGAQSGTSAASQPDMAGGNKAAKPPMDEAASRNGVATKKPAKPGAQSGPATASSPN